VVYLPFKKDQLCNKSITIVIIVTIILFSLIFYSYTFVASGYKETSNHTCGSLEEWLDSFLSFLLIDAFQTMIIPFIIITISNVLIVYKLMKTMNICNEYRNMAIRNENNDNNIITTVNNSNNIINRVNRYQSYRYHLRARKETTKMLFLITTTFLILNFPLASYKGYQFIKNHFINPIKQIEVGSANDETMQTTPMGNLSFYQYNEMELTNYSTSNDNVNLNDNDNDIQYLIWKIQLQDLINKLAYFIYYINFSINFFLYSFNKKQFRLHFYNIFRKIKKFKLNNEMS
jgi:hypothetical protein